MRISVVIPSYKDAAGLWYTVAAARVDLSADFPPDEFEIIGVIDGPEDDETRVILGMRQQGMCKLVSADTRTPQKNRHIGLLAAQGRTVFFLDSHVIPSRGFFKRMAETAEQSGAALVHSGHCFWNQGPVGATAYGYHMDWKCCFWAVTAESTPQSPEAYPIALAGHGAICVNREQYLETGGYWHALYGWGGEEPQLNLKLWLMGKRVLMEPRIYHWHYMPLKRDLKGIQTSEQYVKNFLQVAYVSGGQKYLDAVGFFFTQIHNTADSIEELIKRGPVAPYEAIGAAIPKDCSAERELICSGPFGGDLDKLRDYFMAQNIPH